MGLKNLDIFKNRPARPISFKGIKKTDFVVDKQKGGECWIEALENLYQLYLPTKYPSATNALAAVMVSVINPEAVENKIRAVLVDDFLRNHGKEYGYHISIKEPQRDGSATLIKTITASNVSPEFLERFKEERGSTRAYLQKANNTYIVDDNVGEYASYPTDFGRPSNEYEAAAFPAIIAYYRIICNVLGIEAKAYRFNEGDIRNALSQDRPIYFIMDISGFELYGRSSKRRPHAVLIVDYIQNENVYVIMDSNAVDPSTKKGYCYKVTPEELCTAAGIYASYATNAQLIIPNNGTTWNRVMGM